MVRYNLKRRKAKAKRNNYSQMMKTLLLQNQQIIIQQQNMMFMFMKQHHHHNQTPEQQLFSQPIVSSNQNTSTQQQNQQQTQQLLPQSQQLQQQQQEQENLGHYLTPAASELDPISEQNEDDELQALLGGEGLLHDNLLYNPQTDIGSITPFKGHNEQHLTPTTYYSSGCDSLTTPTVDQPRQPTTANINQNVVKNLADSFKSPTKPQINVQILPGSASSGLKNNKAKIIQRMNISKFLRQVHPDPGEATTTTTSNQGATPR